MAQGGACSPTDTILAFSSQKKRKVHGVPLSTNYPQHHDDTLIIFITRRGHYARLRLFELIVYLVEQWGPKKAVSEYQICETWSSNVSTTFKL